MRYIIVTAASASNLETAVNLKIEQGYVPLGGVTVTTMGNMVQAMLASGPITNA